MSPKLFRPVEVDVRTEAGNVGVGKLSSLGAFRKELRVEDRPRCPSLARVGDDSDDAAEPLRNNDGTPGAVKADVVLAMAL
jgi:hypothetical protein